MTVKNQKQHELLRIKKNERGSRQDGSMNFGRRKIDK